MKNLLLLLSFLFICSTSFAGQKVTGNLQVTGTQTIDTVSNIKGEQQWIIVKIVNPYSYYTNVSQTFEVWDSVDANARLNSIKCSADYAPSPEYIFNLSYADNYISKTNVVTLQTVTSSSGVFSKTSSFSAVNIPTGKSLYIDFAGNIPDSNQKELTCTIGFYYV